MLKETLIALGVLLSMISSIYFIRCGCKTEHSYIDVTPIEESIEE